MRKALAFSSALAAAGGLAGALYGLFFAYELRWVVVGLVAAALCGGVCIAACPARVQKKAATILFVLGVVAGVYYAIFGTEAGRRYVDFRAGVLPEDRPVDEKTAAATTVYMTLRRGVIVRTRVMDRVGKDGEAHRESVVEAQADASECYHRSQCPSFRSESDKVPIALTEARNRGLKRCPACRPPAYRE
jgi:hypothetical protein